MEITIITSIAVALIYVFIIKPKKDKKAAEMKENPTEGRLSFTDEFNVKITGDKQILIKAPSDIKEYQVPETISTIKESAFQDCMSLQSINLGTIYHIEANAFGGCKNLKSVVFPKFMGSIGPRAFMHCESLSSVTIPEGVTTIGNSAFEHCSSLRTVRLPSSVKKIGSYAFAECENLEEIIVPDGEKARFTNMLSKNLQDKIVETKQ